MWLENGVYILERYFTLIQSVNRVMQPVVMTQKVDYIKYLWMKQRVTIQMKVIEQFFHVVMFIMLYKVLLKVRG